MASNAGTYRDWSMRTVKTLTKIQRKLFESAYKALKKNGTLVYSTCTLNEFENEEIIEWALKEFKIKLDKIDMKNLIPDFNNMKENRFDKTIKILPSKNMEGFFVAKFKKI